MTKVLRLFSWIPQKLCIYCYVDLNFGGIWQESLETSSDKSLQSLFTNSCFNALTKSFRGDVLIVTAS